MTPGQLRDRRRKRKQDQVYARQLDEALKCSQAHYVLVNNAEAAQREFVAEQDAIRLAIDLTTFQAIKHAIFSL